MEPSQPEAQKAGPPAQQRAALDSLPAEAPAPIEHVQAAMAVGQQPVKPMVYFATALSMLGVMLVGWDLYGLGTYSMTGCRENFGWPLAPAPGDQDPGWVHNQHNWINNWYSIGGIIGSMYSQQAADSWGRKVSNIRFGVFAFIGTCLMAGTTSNMDMLYAGRCLLGIGTGGLSMTTVCYVAEISPAHIRGAMLALLQAGFVLGMIASSTLQFALSDLDFGWRIDFIVHAAVAGIMMLLIRHCPESPYWLFEVGKTEQAYAAMRQLRQKAEIGPEVALLEQEIAWAQQKGVKGRKAMFASANHMRFRTGVSTGLAALQQATGVMAVMYFAPIIFQDVLGPDWLYYGFLILSLASFFGTLASTVWIERFGRRLLLVYGVVGMAVAYLALGSLTIPDYESSGALSGAVLAVAAMFVFTYGASWGPTTDVTTAELFPLEYRANGLCMSTSTTQGVQWLVSSYTPDMVRGWGVSGTSFFFFAWCALMLVYALLKIPETKGLPLESAFPAIDSFLSMPKKQALRTVHLAPAVQAQPPKADPIAMVA